MKDPRTKFHIITPGCEDRIPICMSSCSMTTDWNFSTWDMTHASAIKAGMYHRTKVCRNCISKWNELNPLDKL